MGIVFGGTPFWMSEVEHLSEQQLACGRTETYSILAYNGTIQSY